MDIQKIWRGATPCGGLHSRMIGSPSLTIKGSIASLGNFGTPNQKGTLGKTLKSTIHQLHKTDKDPKWRFLTCNDQFNLLRHSSSQLVRSIASVFTLELDERLVVKHKSARCVLCFICCDLRRDKVFAIFRPSVPVEANHTVDFPLLITDQCFV